MKSLVNIQEKLRTLLPETQVQRVVELIQRRKTNLNWDMIQPLLESDVPTLQSLPNTISFDRQVMNKLAIVCFFESPSILFVLL